VKKSRVRTGYLARMGEVRNTYRILDGKSERTRPFRRLKHRWEGNIKVGLQEVWC
jgi:hypothetical protein